MKTSEKPVFKTPQKITQMVTYQIKTLFLQLFLRPSSSLPLLLLHHSLMHSYAASRCSMQRACTLLLYLVYIVKCNFYRASYDSANAPTSSTIIICSYYYFILFSYVLLLHVHAVAATTIIIIYSTIH